MGSVPVLEPVPSSPTRITEIPGGPPMPAVVQELLAWGPTIRKAMSSDSGDSGTDGEGKNSGASGWVRALATVAAAIGIAALLGLIVHDQWGNVNLEALFKRQDATIGNLDARIGDLEGAQDKLIKLHEHDAKMDEWRDDAMEALARALEVELPARPTRPAVIPSPRQ